MKHKGFTLIELLIAFAILTVLIVISWMVWKNQINKANDTKRKEDIKLIQTAFEEYYSDNDQYPPANILNNCNGEELNPYLDSIPCDPVTNNPYCYVIDTENSTYQTFRILASFQNTSDSIISELNCDGPDFCGWEEECASTGDNKYNFGLSSTNVTVADIEPDIPEPPPHESGPWACTPAEESECDYYGNNYAANNCPVNFSDPNTCNDFCPISDPSQRCP